MAEHSTVNRRVTGSSPVGGAYKARTPETSSRGFLLYLFLWLEPVTTPPYVSAGALPSGPRADALGGITVFTSLRARKNRHPAVSIPEQQRFTEGSKDASSRARKIFASLGEPSRNVSSPNRQPVYEARSLRKVHPVHARRTRLPNAAGGGRPSGTLLHLLQSKSTDATKPRTLRL